MNAILNFYLGNGVVGYVMIPVTLIIIWWLLSAIVITPGKTAAVITSFGNPHKQARLSGLSLKMPWPVNSIAAYVNLQLMQAPATVEIRSSNGSVMNLNVKVMYRVSSDNVRENAVKAHYELEKPADQIVSFVKNSVPDAASKLSNDQLFQDRSSIHHHVESMLKEQFERYGFQIENVLVDPPILSESLKNAMNSVNEADLAKVAAVNFADAEKTRLIGIATAEKESKKLQGEGIAAMREAVAKGMEVSMETIKKAGLSSDQALDLLTATNRMDTISTAALHGNLILVDMASEGSKGADMTQLIAAVKAAGSHTATIVPHPSSASAAA